MRRGIWNVSVLLCLVLLVPLVGSGQSVGSGSINYYPAGATEYDPLAPIIWDDFLAGTTGTGDVGQLGWSINSTTVSMTTYSLFADRPGVISITNAASATGGIYLPAGFNTRYASVSRAVFWVAANTGANIPDLRVGLASFGITSAPNDDGAYFEHLAADTNWFAVIRDGANETRTDTNVAFSANTWYKLEVRHPAANTWQFVINGATVHTATSGHIPTESYAAQSVYQMKTNGTAVAGYFDYFLAQFNSAR